MVYVLFANTHFQYCLQIIQIYFQVEKIKTLETNVNNELSHMYLWLKVNKLSLNIKKTHYMIFRKRKRNSLNVKLAIGGEPINEADKTKFLGILIDNKWTWKQHIAYVSGKIS